MDQASTDEPDEDATAGTGEAFGSRMQESATPKANILSSTGSDCNEDSSAGADLPTSDSVASASTAVDLPPVTTRAIGSSVEDDVSEQPTEAEPTVDESTHTRTKSTGPAVTIHHRDSRETVGPPVNASREPRQSSQSSSQSSSHSSRSSYMRPTLSPIVEDKPLDEQGARAWEASVTSPEDSNERRKASSALSINKRSSNGQQIRTSAIQAQLNNNKDETVESSELTDWQLWATQVSELLGHVYNEVNSMSGRMEAAEQSLKDLGRRVESGRHSRHREQELSKQIQDVKQLTELAINGLGSLGKVSEAHRRVEMTDNIGNSAASSPEKTTSQEKTCQQSDVQPRPDTTCDVWDLHQRSSDVSTEQMDAIQECAQAATTSPKLDGEDVAANSIEEIAPQIKEESSPSRFQDPDPLPLDSAPLSPKESSPIKITIGHPRDHPTENSWLIPDDAVAEERSNSRDAGPPIMEYSEQTMTEPTEGIQDESFRETMRFVRAFRFKVHGESHDLQLHHSSSHWELRLNGKTVGSLQRSSCLLAAATSLDYQMRFSIPSRTSKPIDGIVRMHWAMESGGKWFYDFFAEGMQIPSCNVSDTSNDVEASSAAADTGVRESTGGLPMEGSAQTMHSSSAPSLMSRMRRVAQFGEALKARGSGRDSPGPQLPSMGCLGLPGPSFGFPLGAVRQAKPFELGKEQLPSADGPWPTQKHARQKADTK